MSSAQLARDQLPHAREAIARSWIVREELLGEPHRAEWKADRLLDALVLRERDLTTAAAEVEQQYAAASSGLGAHYADMNQAAFFQAGDDLHVPAGLGLDPGLKCGGIARIAHGRGGHDADAVDAVRLHRALKTLERAQCGRHGFRRDEPGVEDAAAEAGDFAVFCERFEPVRVHAGDLQSAGVGTDVDGGECRHDFLDALRSEGIDPSPRYTKAVQRLGTWVPQRAEAARCRWMESTCAAQRKTIALRFREGEATV